MQHKVMTLSEAGLTAEVAAEIMRVQSMFMQNQSEIDKIDDSLYEWEVDTVTGVTIMEKDGELMVAPVIVLKHCIEGCGVPCYIS